jgi:hypothetical protein
MSQTSPVVVSRAGAVGIVELARPEKFNCLSMSVHAAIEAAIDGFEKSDSGEHAVTIADEVLEPGWIATQRLHLIQIGAGAEVLALRPDQNGAHTGGGFLEPVDGGLDGRMNGHRQAIEFFGAG